MQIPADTLPPRVAYQHLISLITPRPIAWVSTLSPGGATNLAPFSFFTGITASPPSLLFCVANDRHGGKKDTLRNIEATGEFVVNVVNAASGPAMNGTSATLPYEQSEFEAGGIASVPSVRVKPPRVAAAPAALECTLLQIVRIGEGAGAGNIVIGRIEILHIDDAVVGPDGFADPARLDTIGRLGGQLYSGTRERFELQRPGW